MRITISVRSEDNILIELCELLENVKHKSAKKI
nr:MAG TPA: hypothetical protein [Bacteriophage sp.]